MDAITLLRDDHKAVKQLFRDYEATDHTGRKRKLVDEMLTELTIHSWLEETYFYPTVAQRVPDAADHVLEGEEEHQLVKVLMAELAVMEATDERFDAKVTVLTENVRHHIDEEESDLFPIVREAMGRKPLQELGQTMADARPSAPTDARNPSLVERLKALIPTP